MSILIIDVRDTISPELTALGADLGNAPIRHAMGNALARLIRNHLAELDRDRPNALGGKRTNFYGAAADATTSQLEGSGGFTVSISRIGIRQRLLGGKIESPAGKLLTIPARAEAHGKRAADFPNLKVLWGKAGPIALVVSEAVIKATGRKLKDGTRSHLKVDEKYGRRGEVMFWLRRSVTQQPDPTVLPKTEAMDAVVLDAARAHVAGIIRRARLHT